MKTKTVPLWDELNGVLTGWELLVEERKDANGGAAVRKMIDALKAVERAEATKLPLIVLALEHDGPGEALKKMKTRQGRDG